MASTLSKVFTKHSLDNEFRAIDTLPVWIDGTSPWDVPKTAKHIQFKITSNRSAHSVPMSKTKLMSKDFKPHKRPEKGYVQLLWW